MVLIQISAKTEFTPKKTFNTLLTVNYIVVIHEL